jgi:hypothetical protein
MTDLIINIIGGGALGYLCADFLSQFEWLSDKPFKCNMCLTFWITIIPFILLYGYQGLFVSSLAAITSEILYRQV